MKIVKRGVSTRRVVFTVAVRDVGRVSRLPMTRGSSQAPFPISIAFDFIRSYQQSHPASSASIRCRRFNVCDRGSRNDTGHDQLIYQHIERIHSIDVNTMLSQCFITCFLRGRVTSLSYWFPACSPHVDPLQCLIILLNLNTLKTVHDIYTLDELHLLKMLFEVILPSSQLTTGFIQAHHLRSCLKVHP